MVKFCYSQPKSLPLNKNVHSLRILREGAHGPWATFVGRGGAAVLFIFLFLFLTIRVNRQEQLNSHAQMLL
jgi:hypothetical protein